MGRLSKPGWGAAGWGRVTGCPFCHTTPKSLRTKNCIPRAEPRLITAVLIPDDSVIQAPVWDGNVWRFPAKCLVGIYVILSIHGVFFVLSPPVVHTPSTAFCCDFPWHPRENQAALRCVLRYLLPSLATMTLTARRLCSAISSSGITLTGTHSGHSQRSSSCSCCSTVLLAFLGDVGSSATGSQQPGEAQRDSRLLAGTGAPWGTSPLCCSAPSAEGVCAWLASVHKESPGAAWIPQEQLQVLVLLSRMDTRLVAAVPHVPATPAGISGLFPSPCGAVCVAGGRGISLAWVAEPSASHCRFRPVLNTDPAGYF